LPIAEKRPFERVSLLKQFLLTGGVLLLVAMLSIGAWLGHQIENSATNRAALVTAAYVESIITPRLKDWSGRGRPSPEAGRALDEIFIGSPLARKVVRFKLWSPDGEVLYSSDPTQIGQRFPVTPSLAVAFRGQSHAHTSDPQDLDDSLERNSFPRLLEVYVPVRSGGQGAVVAVAEFYHSMATIEKEVEAAQQRAWLLVALGGSIVFALLYSRVRRGSDLIAAQQRDLRDQLRQLRAALEENQIMRDRLADAGARATALNEQFLLRIGADLHDGPAQNLAFALLRYDEMAQACRRCSRPEGDFPPEGSAIRDAMRASLEELRAIATGLGVPGIAELPLEDTVNRVLRDCQKKWPGEIEVDVAEDLGDASLATKITVYRLLQESMANSRRYANASRPKVSVQRSGDYILVEVSDQGAGFDPQAALASGRLGLPLMRERVRVLGGDLDVVSAPGQGTTIRARLPVDPTEASHV